MKIALKYGLLITLGLVAWVIITHLIVANPQSSIHTLGAPFFFNVLHFAIIYLGLNAMERQRGERQTFKEGLKTGVSITFVYALTASLFFVCMLVFAGAKWLASEPGMHNSPTWLVVAKAFAGLFLLTMVFGLVYSTLISFFLAKRQSGVG